MNEDSKRAVLTKLLPEGEQYVLTLLGQQKSPEKSWCYIGMTDKHMVLAHIKKETPGKLMRQEVIPLDQITDVIIKQNIFRWQIVTMTTPSGLHRLVLKDNTIGTGLDKNLQLQGVKYLCQRLRELA